MIIVAGGGTYWITYYDVNDAKKQSTEAIVKGVSFSVVSQMNILKQSVTKMASVPQVVAAIESEDPEIMKQTAQVLEQFLPKVRKIRILPADISEVDESAAPHMGFADLLMVQESLKQQQIPIIQGLGSNRHLAITSTVYKDQQAIGVILASMDFSFLNDSIKTHKITEGYIELKQEKAILVKAGNVNVKDSDKSSINIPNTSWKIDYWPNNPTSLTTLSTFAGLVILPILIVGLAFFVNYRNLSYLIRQDLGVILRAVKDLMADKIVGNYPINLNEMKSIITSIVKFKRSKENDESDFLVKASEEADLDDMFEEPIGIEFLDKDPDSFMNPDSNFEDLSASPISMPEPADEAESSSVDDEKLFEAALSEANNSAISMPSEQSPTKSSSIDSLFKAYDIRGIVGKTLDKDIVFIIGQAIGSEVKEKNIKTVIVGNDGRSSSPSLSEALMNGIVSTGINVLDIGTVPSPVVYFVTQHTEGKSGVVITGSHNPIDYNGLKIIIHGETLAGEKIQSLKQRIDKENIISTSTPGSIEKNSMFVNEYIGIIADDIHIARPMKVVIDCGNGSASELAPVLFKTLGCEVIEMYCEVDGTFPNHHPDPNKPENLSQLIHGVQQHKADLGLAFDCAGVRLGVIDSKGKIIWPDRQLMLFAKSILAEKPGAEIIYDIKCSRTLNDQISKLNGRPTIWKTGHSLLRSKLKETGAALAGEFSGHFYFNDRWFGFDDALYSAARMIEILSTDSRDSYEVFAEFPESIITPEINIELAEGENFLIIDQFKKQADFIDAEILTIDGLRAEFKDGWGLIRASNTMPLLVLRFEGDTNESLKRIQSQFKSILMQIKPGLSLPF